MFQTQRYTLRIKPVKGKEQLIKKLYANRTSHKDDSGIDLFCLDTQVIKKGSLANTIRFGITCELVKYVKYSMNNTHWHEPISCPYILVPRSSISKTPLRMANSIGIIDAGYRGEILAKVDNLGGTYEIPKGVSYFQIVASDMSPINIEIVDELSKSTRGSGGFGSTGNTCDKSLEK